MTITYYILVAFFSRLNSSEQIALRISKEIKNGEISKYLLLPMGLKKYYYFLCFSNLIIKFLLSIPALTAWILIFHEHFLLPKYIYNIFIFFPILLLGLMWLMQSNLLIILFSFWLDEVYAFFHIKRILFAFFLGEIIPLMLLPLKMQACLNYLPFFYIYNISIEMYFGNRDINMSDYCVIIVWNILFYF
jgi:ABC-2 type transport system permease protein